MVYGAPYVFHFKYGGLGLAPDMNAIAQDIAADSNFQSPVAIAESGGVQVQFIYAGQGSNVGAAAGEMQNVINNRWTMGFVNGLYFVGAEGGSADAQTTPPGADESSIFGGSTLRTLGIGVTVGGVIVGGLGAVLLVRLLR